MGIRGAEGLGNWGKKIPTSLDNVHVTQTNKNSDDGRAVHITTNILGTKAKVHDRYDAAGNYLGSNFGER